MSKSIKVLNHLLRANGKDNTVAGASVNKAAGSLEIEGTSSDININDIDDSIIKACKRLKTLPIDLKNKLREPKSTTAKKDLEAVTRERKGEYRGV